MVYGRMLADCVIFVRVVQDPERPGGEISSVFHFGFFQIEGVKPDSMPLEGRVQPLPQ